MLSKILNAIRSITSYTAAIIIIGTALFSLLYDRPRYRRKGYIKETKIIKFLSYTYIFIGIGMFIILLIR